MDRYGWAILFERLTFLFHDAFYVAGGEGYGAAAELRGIERFEALVVERRVLLRQTEGFVGPSLAVDVTEIWLSVEAVVAFRGKNKPPAVGRP